jgi:hypothetical protein
MVRRSGAAGRHPDREAMEMVLAGIYAAVPKGSDLS